MLDMRSAGGSVSVGKSEQGNRADADSPQDSFVATAKTAASNKQIFIKSHPGDPLTDPFAEWVNDTGRQATAPQPADQHAEGEQPEGHDRLRAAMASVDILTELDEIDREEVPPLATLQSGTTQTSTTQVSLEEILVAELGSEFSRGIAIPPAANDRRPSIAVSRDAIAPTFFANTRSAAENSGRNASTPQLPGRRKAEAAIDRQLLLNRIVRARDAIIAEEQEAAKKAAPAEEPAPAMPEPPAYDTEIEERPGGITRLFTLRRMALAATAIALVAGAAVTAGTGGFALPQPSMASFGLAMPEPEGQGAQASEQAGVITDAAFVAPKGNRPGAMPAATPMPAPADSSNVSTSNVASPSAVKPIVASPIAETPVVEPVAAPTATAARQNAAEKAGIAERINGVEALALLPQQGASPAEEAIRQRLLESGGGAAAQPSVAGSGGASLASAGTLVVNDGSNSRSAKAIAEVPPAGSASAQGTAAAGLLPRDPSAVEAAMAATLGLPDLDPSQREELKNLLVAGECPSTVLSRMFGRAPVVATRDLVRNLENGC
jgi:hypothetical protein